MLGTLPLVWVWRLSLRLCQIRKNWWWLKGLGPGSEFVPNCGVGQPTSPESFPWQQARDQFTRRTFHEPNLMPPINYMKRSASIWMRNASVVLFAWLSRKFLPVLSLSDRCLGNVWMYNQTFGMRESYLCSQEAEHRQWLRTVQGQRIFPRKQAVEKTRRITIIGRQADR